MRAKLAALDVPFEAPDLNEPDFSTLTITRMVAQVVARDRYGTRSGRAHWFEPGRVVAVQAALQRPAAVARLVLLAPALDFGRQSIPALGEGGLERWKASGVLESSTTDTAGWFRSHYELYADAGRYDCVERAR